jgi:tetratricopeptide (TPR) repeat protein
MLRIQQDRLDGHDDVLRKSIDEYPGYHIFECALAYAFAHRGLREEAAAIFERLAAAEFGVLSRDEDWLVNVCLLSEVCVYLRDRRNGLAALSMLAPFTQVNALASGEICLGSVARYAGRLAALLDLHDEAEEHFGTALEMNSRMGARPWFADTQTDLADLLLRRGGRSDRQQAQRLLDGASATFKELGMPRGVARTRSLALGEADGAATPR